MATAGCLIRPNPPFRRDAFVSGLERCGYQVSDRAADRPARDDALVVWNRGAVMDRPALRYEAAGAPVLVAENGYLGREWRGGYWYALARDRHNGAGRWPDGGPQRWDGWGVPLLEWKTGGSDIVILAQRGIGQHGIREPQGFAVSMQRDLALRTQRRVRIRNHPGENAPAVSLQDDLANAWACVTWSSGAALKALMLGVPVFYGCPTWIGRDAALPVMGSDLEQPFRGDRLPMFRRLAWAMWSTDELATGEPFRCLFALPST